MPRFLQKANRKMFGYCGHTPTMSQMYSGAVSVKTTREQNSRCSPFKLTRLSIVEVGGTQLHKEENGEDHINGRKYHIVDNGLDLP